jgi:hypothetical protein
MLQVVVSSSKPAVRIRLLLAEKRINLHSTVYGVCCVRGNTMTGLFQLLLFSSAIPNIDTSVASQERHVT